jgi:hypothetical protein
MLSLVWMIWRMLSGSLIAMKVLVDPPRKPLGILKALVVKRV